MRHFRVVAGLMLVGFVAAGCGEKANPGVFTSDAPAVTFDLPVAVDTQAGNPDRGTEDAAADIPVLCPEPYRLCNRLIAPLAGDAGAADVPADSALPGTRQQICVDLQSDPRSCGMCDTACNRGEFCVDGRCVVSCQADQTECMGRCVNIRADNTHCGMCGRACTAGFSCVDGTCQVQCLAPIVACPGTGGNPGYCADTRNDAQNCGGCGRACLARQLCVAGACTFQCFSPLTACPADAPTSCVDLRFDPGNCGACGRACAADRQCVAGSCCVPVSGAAAQVPACTSMTGPCSEAIVLRNGQSAAQSFRVPGSDAGMVAGFLTRVRLRVANPYASRLPPLPMQVLIVNGGESEDALATTSGFITEMRTVARTSLVGGVTENWHDAVFLPPVPITGGSTYYIVLRLPTFAGCEAPCAVAPSEPGMCSCPGVRWARYNRAESSTDDPYEGGRSFYCGDTCSIWSPNAAARDHAFEVYLSSACLSP